MKSFHKILVEDSCYGNVYNCRVYHVFFLFRTFPLFISGRINELYSRYTFKIILIHTKMLFRHSFTFAICIFYTLTQFKTG